MNSLLGFTPSNLGPIDGSGSLGELLLAGGCTLSHRDDGGERDIPTKVWRRPGATAVTGCRGRPAGRMRRTPSVC
jgi:hypothetical protein